MDRDIYEPEKIDYNKYDLGELQEVIGIMEDEVPKDKRSRPYKEWVKDINNLFNIYNLKAKSKVYVKIK